MGDKVRRVNLTKEIIITGWYSKEYVEGKHYAIMQLSSHDQQHIQNDDVNSSAGIKIHFHQRALAEYSWTH